MSSLRTRFTNLVTHQRRRPRIRPNLVAGVDIATYLPLQMVLYFNAFYAPFWAVSSILALQTKYDALPYFYKPVTILVYSVMLPVEIGRLYLAYEGNLREKVPMLVSFWLLSLLQTLLTIYTLANQHALALPLERGVSIPLLVILIAQLVLGVRALHLIVGAQALKFHLMQSDTQEEEEARGEERRVGGGGGGVERSRGEGGGGREGRKGDRGERRRGGGDNGENIELQQLNFIQENW